MTMRAQLALPEPAPAQPQAYNQIFTMHGTGMIALVVTPLAFGLGVYLVPLMIGAPTIAAPRVTLLGYWLYVVGALSLLWARPCRAGPPPAGGDTRRCPTAPTPRAPG